MVAAKVAVVAAVMLAVGTVLAAASFGVSQAILSGRHAGVSIGHPGALRAVAATALLAPVCALTGLGIGALIRHTAPAIAAVCVVLVVLPGSLQPDARHWVDDLANTFPYVVWNRMIDLKYVPGSSYLPTITGSWVVFAAWPLAAVTLAAIVVRHRDL